MPQLVSKHDLFMVAGVLCFVAAFTKLVDLAWIDGVSCVLWTVASVSFCKEAAK